MPAAKRLVQPAKRVKARILIVEARYYERIADALLAGAKSALTQAGASFDVLTVPGALEIPPAIAMASKNYDGAVALGCVIRGETFHFEIVAMESARALMDFSVAHRFPVGNGILTVDTESQAMARAGQGEGDKGAEAARAALALLAIQRAGKKK